ncbi:hypothetical protein AVL57_12390 [Alteromonas stellipolaris]|uniref:Zinc-binding domain-containing protein n=2 Tax=Alteromonas stellipolaris TaxID=233316 RepID=A0ABN4LL48_9ALTE|nr:hypothetical protein AVL57_12390 [Alteromonas stellipolaris]
MEDKLDINRLNWHKSSYLGHYDKDCKYYEGIRCRCQKCDCSFVFTPEEQKQKFEIDKVYPGWLPTLCFSCTKNWNTLNENILGMECRWETERNELALNKQFLSQWLELIRTAQPYKKKQFDSRIGMILKILNK